MATSNFKQNGPMRATGVFSGIMRVTSVVVAFALALSLFLLPSSARADELSEAQQRVEETGQAYASSVSRIEELEKQIAENEARIKELEADLPEQRERGGEALGELYKINRESFSLIDLILSSTSIGDFLSNIEFLDRVYGQHMGEVESLQAMLAELDATEQSLAASLEEARAEEQRASAALAEAQEAREQAQAAALAQQAEDLASAGDSQPEAGAAGQDSENTYKEPELNEQPATPSAPETQKPSLTPPSADNANWSSDKQAFVDAWAGRLNAYLSGSPLGGYGAAFAAAAWDAGIDPRYSAAISCVESSKGAQCFRPHNAWGWGNKAWSSWDEAISAHASGLARLYGYTLSVAAAKKYCPPNWEHWYTRVGQEMNKI